MYNMYMDVIFCNLKNVENIEKLLPFFLHTHAFVGFSRKDGQICSHGRYQAEFRLFFSLSQTVLYDIHSRQYIYM